MKFFSKLKNSKKYFLILFLAATAFALSCISEASSSRTITLFFKQDLSQLTKSIQVMFRAVRNDIDESAATIETSPTKFDDNTSMMKVLMMNDLAVSGGASKETAGALIQFGQKIYVDDQPK